MSNGNGKAGRIAADICLYGAPICGHGWLATLPGSALLGDGEVKLGRGLTETVWLALEAVEKAGAVGAVRVFCPGGERFAWTRTGERTYYGNLVWETSPVYVIDYADLVSASK